jgi:hypothetical protein
MGRYVTGTITFFDKPVFSFKHRPDPFDKGKITFGRPPRYLKHGKHPFQSYLHLFDDKKFRFGMRVDGLGHLWHRFVYVSDCFDDKAERYRDIKKCFREATELFVMMDHSLASIPDGFGNWRDSLITFTRSFRASVPSFRNRTESFKRFGEPLEERIFSFGTEKVPPART